MPKPKRKIFLASGSPRRTEILKKLNIQHTVIKNIVEEEKIDPLYLKKSLRALAFQKAYLSQKNYQGLIIGVDTIVSLNHNILGKPANLSEAQQYLHFLSQKTHQVISGICVYDSISRTKICRTETTHVTFKKLSTPEIQNYCQQYHVLDKAGGYAIQDCQSFFISKIKGSFYNVMGLPVTSLLNILKNYAIIS